MEIKLCQVPDPIDYVLSVLRKQVSALEVLQTNPRATVATIYVENGTSIDECHRDANVAWNRLRDTVIAAGNVKIDVDAERDRVVKALTHGVVTAQKVCDLFDDLCERYGIPDNDPHLFVKIGSVLHK